MTPGHDEDAALMLQAQRGDLAAFELLVERYRQPVFHFILRTIADAEEAEDLAQQVFLQAWKAVGRYRAASKFSTWLFTIARNLCLNEIRRRGRHPTEPLPGSTGAEDGAGGGEHEFPDAHSLEVVGEVLLAELQGKIGEALADLPEMQRSALTLFREQELAYEDIGRVLGVSLSATKSLIHRARETLKARLKEYLRSGAWTRESVRPETFPPPRV